MLQTFLEMSLSEWIQLGGLTLLFIVIFLECGTLIGVFLPGESLLFVTGLSCKIGVLEKPLSAVLITAFLAGILGTLFGYYTGAKSRYKLIHKKDDWLFKRRYFAKTKLVFRRYRGRSLLIGRFFPVLRSVLPIFAGIVRMHFGWFLAYSLLGMSVWSQSFVLLGYWLGEVMPEIKDYFVYAVAGLLAISIVPPLLKYVLQFLRKGKMVG